MRIAIIDLFGDAPLHSRSRRFFARYFIKQFMAITPQAIAVWCRSLGHEVHYATYYGQQDPLSLVPKHIDVLFVACYTRYSALAYALATIFRRQRVLTVIGGPHARSFPTDCLRFFDIVVKDCDKALIADILNGHIDPPAVATSGKALSDMPSVEERMPEITTASFHRGRPLVTSTVPMLASTGCPYSCGFCIDWNTPYAALPRERIVADLTFLSRRWPRLLVGYHDPNFAVHFDKMMELIEELPESARNPYTMESSLSILKEERLVRLRRTNCVYVAPGIESWIDYSNKAGAGAKRGREKLSRVVAHIKQLGRHVPGVQANFIFGGESDQGDEPANLTKEFIAELPEVWPTVNIPAPFGGTPFYDQLHREGRILSALPFAFYYTPNLAIVPKHYDATTYYSHLIDIYEAITSSAMLIRRMVTKTPPVIRAIHSMRALANRTRLQQFRHLHRLLQSDTAFRSFHEGRSDALPEFYHNLFERRLGRYAELLPREARRPILEPPAAPRVRAGGAGASSVVSLRA
jgi:radical SAM superfamily enzyme YgiQ (UPF0313 family)